MRFLGIGSYIGMEQRGYSGQEIYCDLPGFRLRKKWHHGLHDYPLTFWRYSSNQRWKLKLAIRRIFFAEVGKRQTRTLSSA